MSMRPLITHPVIPPIEHGGNRHGGHASRRDSSDNGPAGEFSAATADAAEKTARPSSARQLATARDALQFRLQTETLPGPGSAAPFVAQQIGQLWIAPDARIGHGPAAAAYQRTISAVDQYIAAAIDRPVTA